MDLFASRLSAQLPRYIAWKLDPCSQETDAMQQIWSNQYLYAFTPLSSDKQDHKKDGPGPSGKNVDCSSHMAASGMVPNPSENFSKETNSFATPATSIFSDRFINNKQNIKISCFDGFS